MMTILQYLCIAVTDRAYGDIVPFVWHVQFKVTSIIIGLLVILLAVVVRFTYLIINNSLSLNSGVGTCNVFGMLGRVIVCCFSLVLYFYPIAMIESSEK